MYRPLVSIVTPAYNAGPYIEETLESVLAQDYEPLELILVDDGSTGDTLTRLAPYLDRIRLIRQENGGEAAAVNRGVAAAQGEILGIVNADDPILPGLVATAVAALAADSALQGVYPDWLKIDAAGLVMEEMQAPEYDYRVLLGQHLCMIGPGCLFRRDGLAGEPPRDPRFRYTGDFHQWLRMGLRGPFARIPATFATWRHHEAGASQARRDREMAANKIDAVRDILDRAELPEGLVRLRGEAMSTAYYIAAVLGLDNPAIPARRYMLQSLRQASRWPPGRRPERRRSWRLVVFALGLPFTRPLASLYRRALPNRFKLPVGTLHYRDWRPLVGAAAPPDPT
jgi:glycosyltransferase involved in cell wall biosynthesis